MTLESFFGLDTDSSGSAESREKFQEMMRESAKAAKAISGHQAAQKKQEDKLAKILMRYMKDSGKSDIVFLVIKLLQENVPGAFILAALSIADPEMEKELRTSFEAGKPEDSSLSTFAGEAFIPEEIKLELNAWGDAILKAGLLMPGKTLQNVLTPELKLKSLVLDLLQFALEEFLDRHGIEFSEERIRQVCLLSIQMVLVKLREVAKEKTDIEIIETPVEASTEATPL
jgi:hypothetical protein